MRAVHFDAVGTVIHPTPSAPAVYAALARRHGAAVDEREMRRRIVASYNLEEVIDRGAGWATSEDREHDRWRRIVAASLPEAPDAAACFAELFEHFARPESWTLDPDVPAVFAALKDRGVRFGIASNYDSRLRRVLAGFPEFAGVPVAISSELGVRKPAKAFFDALSPEVPRADVLFVGDDYGNDYVGASEAGLSAVLLDPAARRPDARRIARLADLMENGTTI